LHTAWSSEWNIETFRKSTEHRPVVCLTVHEAGIGELIGILGSVGRRSRDVNGVTLWMEHCETFDP